MMHVIKNTRELPNDMLRCFVMSQTQAENLTTEYQSAWFYPLARTDKGYLYMLDAEYQIRQQENRS